MDLGFRRSLHCTHDPRPKHHPAAISSASHGPFPTHTTRNLPSNSLFWTDDVHSLNSLPSFL